MHMNLRHNKIIILNQNRTAITSAIPGTSGNFVNGFNETSEKVMKLI